jgi:hypothetical protein
VSLAQANRMERRYHYEIQKHAQAVMNHRAALSRWISQADTIGGAPLVEIAEAGGTNVEGNQDVIDCDGMFAREDGQP